MAGLILMRNLKPQQKAAFSREMAMAGEMKGKHCPRLQLLCVPDILAGRRFTLPEAPAARGSKQGQLPFPTEVSLCPEFIVAFDFSCFT
ncbi:MAG: hypothetical protein M2R45_02971 [Verrucomicrobia subdivision 3 bacterium]|nr:hypothetical protein [Limisphaerales bacterium]